MLTTTVLELLPFRFAANRTGRPARTYTGRALRLFVCWDNRAAHPVIGAHPCGVAYEALRDAGHDPEVVKAYGWAKLPAFLNQTSGRRRVHELTGAYEVPVLELDDGDVVAGSDQIVFWAEANPAPGSA